MQYKVYLRALGFALAGLLCWATTLQAQVQVGNDTQLNLDGSISTGYAGSVTNQGPDSHGLVLGGTGNLSGSYYSPQFLSFDVAPYFNQSRDNSNYQSITDTSGVVGTASIFGGSQFPGYFNFSKSYNSESSYLVPGLANYATNGNTDTLGVGWSAHFHDLPYFTFGYQQGNSNYSIYGTQQERVTDFHSVFGNVSYAVDGFRLNGGIHYSNSNSLFPGLVSDEPAQKANSDTTTYTLNMARNVVWNGSSWVNFTRNATSYDDLGLSSSETSDIVTGGVSLKPTAKFTTQITGDYDDNLAGAIFQSVTSTGATVPVVLPEAPSHSWGLLGGAQYSVFQGFFLTGTISHREQLFLGSTFDSTGYSGGANFGHHLFGGQFTAALTLSRSSYGTQNEALTGLLGNVIYIRKIGAWNVSGTFNYSRDAQTILIAYTSSGYSYSASLNRAIGRLNWTAGSSASKSMLTQVQGTTNTTQGYSTGLSGRWLGVGGAYTKSSGSGLLTPTGIAALPPGVTPTFIPAVLYGGTTYSASLGSTPRRGLSITGSYVQSQSNTTGGSITSNNKTEQAYAYLNYRFRKVYFNAGYSRLLQGFSASGVTPAMISTYYFGISRWFKAF